MADPIPQDNSQDDVNETQSEHENSATQPNLSSPAPTQSRNRQSRKPVYISLLGPSGSGKTLLSNTVCDEQAALATVESGPCTTSFRYRSLVLAEREVRLIDSPGLSSSAQHNCNVLYRLVCYLMKMHNSWGQEIAGILYLHPEGSDLGCAQLKQNIVALQTLIGDRHLSHLKIAIVPSDSNLDVDASSIRTLQGPASPFHDVYLGGAEIVGLPLRSEKIRELLSSYTHLRHRLFRVQKRILSRDIKDWESYVERIFGLSSTEAQAAHPRRSTDRVSSRSLGDDLAEATEQCTHLELALAESEGEIKHLRNQLEQTQAEYASLRSELQLNDNTEQSRIAQSLKDLNRCVENLGRSIAEHIVDCYIPAGADGETTLEAKDLLQIKAQFRHQEGRPSLVTSSSGDGMPIEDFFDLGIRSMLCRRLYENIFLPFHPTLSGDPRNEFMDELYREIRYRDHQTTASKWRANSFLAISNGHDATTRIEHIHKHAENIKTQELAVLFTSFFGKNVQISLTDSHNEEIERLVSLAWDWNVTLKGSVVMLGDFQPTIHDSGVAFNPECMADFEPKKGSRRAPNIALCTVGLGLMVSRSKTAGNPLGQSIVCKATVVTEHIYE